ncbi:hypothetical protein B296_00057161 [Ensete ventricosum]|uniref:Uncharacterized protein n=1 Tax=Ensete ventricosum TaxID=4639 RepID=A0A426XSI9_ENSVE|nr:hypothetical protein B296_00057161 [Ensete ventricosum]
MDGLGPSVRRTHCGLPQSRASLPRIMKTQEDCILFSRNVYVNKRCDGRRARHGVHAVIPCSRRVRLSSSGHDRDRLAPLTVSQLVGTPFTTLGHTAVGFISEGGRGGQVPFCFFVSVGSKVAT